MLAALLRYIESVALCDFTSPGRPRKSLLVDPIQITGFSSA
jgi:hypothetical protein